MNAHTGNHSNTYLSPSVGAGPANDVSAAWDRGNDDWWDWYMSLADNDSDVAAGELTLTDLPAENLGELPSASAVADELAQPYAVPADALAAYAADGFVKLPGVISAGTAEVLRRRMEQLLAATSSGTGLRSREMMWQDDPLARAAVLSPRIGGICAALLGVERLRLYHDSALCKEPGAGRTPWHYDAHHFPLDSHDVISTWMPLQSVPRAMGPLAFACGMRAWRLVADIDFDKHTTSYDRAVAEVLRAAAVDVSEQPFDIGDVSFHSTLCLHTAGANRTTRPRMVLGSTYFADGASIIDSPTMVSGDWQLFVPDTRPGEPAASENNPLLEQAG